MIITSCKLIKKIEEVNNVPVRTACVIDFDFNSNPVLKLQYETSFRVRREIRPQIRSEILNIINF